MLGVHTTEGNMPTFTKNELIDHATIVLKAAGTPESKAQLVAGYLAEANCAGHDSHGVIRLPQYLEGVEKEEIIPDADVAIIRENPIMAILAGNWGFGQVTTSHATELGIKKARKSGMAAIAVRQANHIGRLGSYVDQIAREGMVGMMFVNAVGVPQFRMAPWGGTEPRLVTDPLAFGIPHSSGVPVVVDMTTTVVAEGKVRVARNRGVETPDGWLLNSKGQPTNDPNELYTEPPGSILPLGGAAAGHKGYALNVALELLAGVISGSGYTGKDMRLRNGVLLLVLDIEQFISLDEFYKESDEFVAHVKSSPPAEGFDEILLPGEIEARITQKRDQEGIDIEEETWRQIVEWGKKLGVSLQ